MTDETNKALATVERIASNAVGMPFQTAVIVRNELIALPDVVVVDSETNIRAGSLVNRAHSCKPVTADEVDHANALFKELDALLKAINEMRLTATRPIDAFVKKVIEAERSVTIPLAGAREALGHRIRAAHQELQAARERAERQARAEAEAAAEKERQRIAGEQAEAAKKALAERAELVAKRDREVAMFGESDIVIAGEAETATAAAAAVPQTASVVAVVDVSHLPAMPTTKAVRSTTRPKLVIDDAKLIPREIAGKVLLVPDEKAIEGLLKLGIPVPGCRLEAVAGIAATGAR